MSSPDAIFDISSSHPQQKYDDLLIGCISILSAFVVSLAGVIPFVVYDKIEKLHNSRDIHFVLCFAVGSLLGNVFLHVFPESTLNCRSLADHQCFGALILFGFVTFFVIEKCMQMSEMESSNQIAAGGYLNLLANCCDNFAHGLSIGASYLSGIRIGLLTSAIILVHEIPHEFGDVAILIKAGFSPWSAAKAQFISGLMGIAGAATSIFCEMFWAGANLTFILPFTAGGFLYVAMVSILPDILRRNEADAAYSVASILTGALVMWIITFLCGG